MVTLYKVKIVRVYCHNDAWPIGPGFFETDLISSDFIIFIKNDFYSSKLNANYFLCIYIPNTHTFCLDVWLEK